MSSLTAEELARLILKLQKPTTDTLRHLAPLDIRSYYHVRIGLFETVVDSRDCDMTDPYDYAITEDLQPWYYVANNVPNDTTIKTTKWTRAQYVDWLRGKDVQ